MNLYFSIDHDDLNTQIHKKRMIPKQNVLITKYGLHVPCCIGIPVKQN